MSDIVDLPWAHPSDTNPEILFPGARSQCVDGCGILIAKCGEINRWHWAHQGDAICTGEGEGAWHRAWKQWSQNHGAVVEMSDHPRRPDIVWPDGHIYECQTDYIDAAELRKREQHYGESMTWIYRWLPGRFDRLRNAGDGWFKWSRPAPSMALHERPIIWHHLDRLYDVTTKMTPDGEVHIRFERGEPDRYGPVLYGSRPAPFHVGEAVAALDRFEYDAPEAA